MPRAFALSFALLLAAAPAPALTIDFEDFSDGDVVAAPSASYPGYQLIANSFRSADVAIVHDTTPDEPEFESDSLQPQGIIVPPPPRDSGNVLVFSDSCLGSSCASFDGGSLLFVLDDSTDSLSFDWIGFGERVGPGLVRFLDGLVEVGRLDLSPSGAGIQHEVASLSSSFDAVQFLFFGSIGLDNIATSPAIPTPEPASAGMIGLGLAALAIAGKRRHR